MQIRDAMGNILKQLPLDLNKTEDAFSKDLLLLMLKQYELFLDSFQFALQKLSISTKDADIAKVMGFESKDEYNEIMFLREITHTVNAFNDMADVARLYSKKPEAAEQRLANLFIQLCMRILNQYSKTTGVVIYLHARSISTVPDCLISKGDIRLWQKDLLEKRKEMVLPLLCRGRKR